MVGIIVDLVPLLRTHVAGEIAGIEGGAADHGQNFAIARVLRDDGSLAAFHGELGDGLQIQIEGGLEVLAGGGLLVLQRFPGAAARIDQDALLPVDAHQDVVVLALESGFADALALRILGEFGGVEIIFADFADVTDDVRGHAVLRI